MGHISDVSGIKHFGVASRQAGRGVQFRPRAILKVKSFAGSPEGLSFSRTRNPEVEAVLNVKEAVKSVGFPLCQLPGVTSLPVSWAMSLPVESVSFIGKVPSNIQPAGTVPVTLRGLVTLVPAEGEATIGSFGFGVGDMVGAGVA